MKKIYYLLLTLAISSLSFGQVEVFNLAGGSAFPDGWTATNNVASYDIDRGSYFLLDSGDPSDIIVSAVYDLSAYSSAEFNLDVATFGSGDNNSATIEISYDGGATYTSSETTAVPTSSSYIAGGTFAVTPSAQVVIKLTNTGVAGKGNRLRNLVLTGASASPLQITTSVCATATSVRLTGPWWGWDPTGGPEAVSNNDGTWTFTFDPAPTDNMEYLLVVDGVQENLISIMANGGTCAPVTDSANYANRQWILDSGDVTNNYGQCGTTCVAPVITLLGGDETITVGDTYTDAGATASDDEQGDITSDILGITDLDTSVAGEYTVAYNVSDGALNAATEVVRTVTVEAVPVCTASEGFETFPLVDWTLYSSNTSNGVTQSTTWANSGLNSLRFASYSSASTYDQYAVTPQLVTTSGDQTISFYYRSSNGSERFKVGTSSTGDDFANDFTWSDEIVSSTTAAQYSISDLPVGTTYVAIHYYSNYQYYMYVDDFCMPELYVPDCVAPTALDVADVTTTTASVSWTADSSQTAWEYQVVAGGATPAETGDATSDNPLALNGLTSNTTYDVYVRANCGTDGTSEWVMVSFITECDAVTAFPYTEDFDTDWSCWSVNNADGDNYTWSQSDAYITPRSGDFTAHGMGSNNDYLISPKFSLTGNERVVWYDIVESANNNNTYDVLLSTTGKEISDFTVNLGTYDCTNETWTEHILDLSAYTGDVYIALHQTYSAATYYGFGVDDFTVMENPSCIDPTDVTVADITTTTASVSWTADSSQTAWEYQVVLGGATPAETGEATSDNPLALTELTANTTYDVYVRANCGTDGTSEWVMVSFITECDAVTAFPYTEDFDTDWSCWSVNNADGDNYTWSQSDTYITPRSGDFTAHGMGSNNDYLISPKFSLTGNERVVWYDIVESASYNNTYDVLLSTTGKEISDFTVNLGTYDCTNVTWTEHILNLSAYTGDIYIALHQTNSASSYYGFGVDDFTVMENPSCIDPTDVTVADITTTTASVSWTADSSQTAWEYQVVAGGATPAETGEATSDNPLALNGLTSNTTYDVYVRANCGTDGTSEWGMVSFTTLPDPIVPNYTNDFATFPGDLWSQAEGAIADGPSGSTSLWDTGNFAHGTNAPAAYINIYSSNRDEWLISPSFDLSGVNYYLNVDVAATEYLSSFSTADPVDAIWGVDDFVTLMVSEDSGSTWNELYRWDANNNPGVAGAAMPEIDLSAYTGLAKFAFYAESTASNEDIDFFVDNFSITSTSLGLEDVNTTSNFTYFPNPVNNVLSIKAQASIDSITVYNMLGQTVVRSTPNTTTTAVDMSGLQTGAYFVQVAINNSIETVRVIKN